jgi:ABC-type transport system involved in multi-copper enzyme maturation permease subunit
MVIPPVLDRELRSASRFWATYWLRVLAGVTMALLLTGVAVGEYFRWGGAGSLPSSLLGSLLLSAFHGGLTVFFLFACPMATADTLARERREGTIGLLFLTPLTAREVVIGKTSAQVVRMFALWLSVVPFLAIPFLLGGVGLPDFARALVVELSVVLTGLAAGFLATSRARTWMGAVGSAGIWMLFLMLLQAGLCIAVFLRSAAVLGPGTSIPWDAWPAIPFGVAFASAAYGGVSGTAGFAMGGLPTWVIDSAHHSLLAMLTFAGLLFVAAVWISASLLERQRRTERLGFEPGGVGPRTPRQAMVRQRQRRWLSINPVVWLESMSPGLRRGRWMWWLLVVVCHLAAYPLRNYDRDIEFVVLWVGPVILVFEALMAAGSFRREIEEGTLEILLVTPLRPADLVGGRRLAMLVGFGPGVVAAVVLPMLAKSQLHLEHWIPFACLLVSTWLTLPWVGMRCAMRRLHPLMGWAMTLAWGVAAPMAVGAFLAGWLQAMSLISGWSGFPVGIFSVATVACQWVAALWWGRMTVWDLETRNYQLRPLARIKPRP